MANYDSLKALIDSVLDDEPARDAGSLVVGAVVAAEPAETYEQRMARELAEDTDLT